MLGGFTVAVFGPHPKLAQIVAAPDLLALINHFNGAQVLSPPIACLVEQPPHYSELTDIKGQETAKRALKIAAAGGHNLLLAGPPGTGKTMLARRLPSIQWGMC